MSEFSILQDLLAMTGEMAPYPQMSPAVVADMPLADQLGETLATLVDVERSCNLTDLDATTISGQNHAILDMEPTTFSGNETGHFGGYQAAGYMTEFEDVSEPSASPAPSIASSNGGSFSFPPQAPTPEAALPLEECLAQCPSMDTSLFFKQEVTEEKVRDMEKETSTTAKALAAHIKKRRKASGLEEVPSRNKDDKREANEVKRQLSHCIKSDTIDSFYPAVWSNANFVHTRYTGILSSLKIQLNNRF